MSNDIPIGYRSIYSQLVKIYKLFKYIHSKFPDDALFFFKGSLIVDLYEGVQEGRSTENHANEVCSIVMQYISSMHALESDPEKLQKQAVVLIMAANDIENLSNKINNTHGN